MICLPTLAADRGARRTRPPVLGRCAHDGAGGGGGTRPARVLTGCGSASVPSPPSGVDELVIPTPSPDPDDFVGPSTTPGSRSARDDVDVRRQRRRGHHTPMTVTAEPARRSPGSRHGAGQHRGRTGRDRLVRPGRPRQRLVVRPRGQLAGRRGRRRGRAGDAGHAAGRGRLRPALRARSRRGHVDGLWRSTTGPRSRPGRSTTCWSTGQPRSSRAVRTRVVVRPRRRAWSPRRSCRAAPGGL